MGMPQLIVTAVLVEGRTKSEVARDYGVSRRWAITLVQRSLAEGEAELAPRSRRPRRRPRRSAEAVEDEIVEIRKGLDRHGHEAGAATIAFHLQARHGTAPAVSTIWRILSARGFVIAPPHKRPKSSYIRFAADQPNQRWQSDITHWALADGTDVEILHWLDDHSRLLLASTAADASSKAPTARPATRQIAAGHGEPAAVLSDNGAVYTGRYRGRGESPSSSPCTTAATVFTHSRPKTTPRPAGRSNASIQTRQRKRLAKAEPPARTADAARRTAGPARRLIRGYYNTQQIARRRLHLAEQPVLQACRARTTSDPLRPAGAASSRRASCSSSGTAAEKHAGTVCPVATQGPARCPHRPARRPATKPS